MSVSQTEFRARVDAARDRHLLSEIVGRHTALKRRGARELVGLCMFHQERTPSLEVNDAKGTYHCWGCGAGGDALTFLRKAEGLTFSQALEALVGDQFPVISEEERAKRKAEDAANLKARVELALSFWHRAGDPVGTLAETYARRRGIEGALPDTVRFAAIPRFVDLETGEVGRDYPAVVCALQDAAGDITGVQAIYLAPDGTKYRPPNGSKAKLTWGAVIGSALRMGPPANHVVICEGPEDSWTLAQQLPGQTVWASCGTANLSRLTFPSQVRRVTVAGDNNDAGRLAADQAQVEYLARGLEVAAIYPDPPFRDWNDELLGVTA